MRFPEGRKDSVGGTPTEAVGTTALPEESKDLGTNYE
jgi:hypothetical protein